MTQDDIAFLMSLQRLSHDNALDHCGYRRIVQLIEENLQCPDCHGSGYESFGDTNPNSPEPPVGCQLCEGSGYLDPHKLIEWWQKETREAIRLRSELHDRNRRQPPEDKS